MVEDSASQSVHKTLRIAVDPGPAPKPGALIVGHGRTQDVTALLTGFVAPGLPGDALTLTAFSASAGAATLANGVATFAAPASGAAVLAYTVEDEFGQTAQGEVAVTIDPGPRVEGTTTLIPGRGASYDLTSLLTGLATPGLPGDALKLTAISASAGTATLKDGVAAYDAPASGAGSLTFTVADAYGDETTGRVTVTTSSSLANQTRTVFADGSKRVRVFAPGSWQGLTFSSYENAYDASGVRTAYTIYEGFGRVPGGETFGPGGAYAITLGGAPVQVKTVAADKSYDVRVYKPGLWRGVAYASSNSAYDASGFRVAFTVYDAAGQILGRETFSPDGGFTITVGGALAQVKTVAADHTYDVRAYAAGSWGGFAYAS